MDMPMFGVGIRQGNSSNTRLAVVYFLLAIVVSMMAKPAHASGTVNLATIYYGGWNISGYNCSAMSSLNEVQECMLAMHDKWLANDLSSLNSNTAVLPPEPLSCPAAVLTDSGPSSAYVDIFHITYYRGGINAAGWTCCPINYKICDGPKVDDFNISTNLACPANSQLTDSTCTCDNNFMPDPTATSCVPSNSCPANMSGPPCTCILGTVPNPSEAGCVVEQFTLEQNETLLPDMEPGLSRVVTARVVSDQTGLPKQGAIVRFHLDVDPISGGHDHGENPARRPRGTISSSNCVPESGGDPDTYDCPTGSNGYTDSTFNAPEVSGTHTIDATCISTQCSGSITEHINVKVGGLWPISPSPYYALTEDGTSKVIGSTTNHSINHYVTSGAQLQLWQLAQNFYEYQIRNGIANPTLLHINDASLKWGGMFDIDGDWNTPHKEHRRGTDIDIRANSASGAIPPKLTMNYNRIAKDLGIDAHLEYDNDPVMRHFHTRLLNRKE